MFRQLLADPVYALVFSAILLAMVAGLIGLALLLREALANPWRQRCNEMLEQNKLREARLSRLAASLADATGKIDSPAPSPRSTPRLDIDHLL